MRHAYYLAENDTLHGDKELGEGLREKFQTLGLYPNTKDNIKVGRSIAGFFDGISRYERTTKDDKVVVVEKFCVRDFFNPKPMTFYQPETIMEK